MESFLSHISELGKPVKNKIAFIERDWDKSVSLLGDFRKPSDTIYDCYPYLFRSLFSSIDEKTYLDFAVASRLFAASIITYDKLIDADYPDKNLVTFSPLIMQWEAVNNLRFLFESQSAFWQRFSIFYQEHIEACAKEKYFQQRTNEWGEIEEAFFLDLAIKKNGISRAVIAGLTELAKDGSLYDPLIESINNFNIACQILDDLFDWKKDLRAFSVSLLLTKVFRDAQEDLIGLEPEKLNDLVGKKIYYQGYGLETIRLGIKCINKSKWWLESVGTKDIDWYFVIKQIEQKLISLEEDITKITQRNIKRVKEQPPLKIEYPKPKNKIEKLAGASLKYLIKQWKLGFGETRHIMQLKNTEGFSTVSVSEYRYGDVFQRALISTILSEVQNRLDINLNPVIETEIKYLVSKQSKDGVRGWRYFPEVLEIAPDADDLGQVIQSFITSGNKQLVVELCEPVINELLNNNLLEDGALETWIVPKENRTELQETQHKFNTQKWGIGPDVEVVANFIYSLHLYDKDKFKEINKKAVNFLRNAQKQTGAWESRWYFGDFYGTYVCTRTITAIELDLQILKKVENYIRKEQKKDGGWGNNESDQLNTALSLLILYELNKTLEINKETLVSGFNFLLNSVFSGNRDQWQSVDFIKPRVGEPYASKTITAMYICFVASCWKDVIDF